MTKEQKTLEYIELILEVSKNPIVLCSFGKDSMIMLYLIRKVRKDISVLFFKEPFFPKKYHFANKVIEDWELTVYDFPPIISDYIKHNNDFEVVNWYNGYGKAMLYLPTGICQRNGDKKYLCVLKDLLTKPLVNGYSFMWDTIFVGHKNNDIDPILGHTKLDKQTIWIQQMMLALPIKDWSDEDIWNYTLEHDIPYNDKRYDKDNNFKEFKDMTYNNDYHPTCTLCIDNTQSDEIICPKDGKKKKNIALSDKDYEKKRQRFKSMMRYVKEV